MNNTCLNNSSNNVNNLLSPLSFPSKQSASKNKDHCPICDAEGNSLQKRTDAVARKEFNMCSKCYQQSFSDTEIKFLCMLLERGTVCKKKNLFTRGIPIPDHFKSPQESDVSSTSSFFLSIKSQQFIEDTSEPLLSDLFSILTSSEYTSNKSFGSQNDDHSSEINSILF